ncbi:MAG TPA: hypothetical protein DER11_01325 [Janibacter terrae]|uniref:hypothetical protein n=1 Tax=Janibacter terrae TaxID=103817 RepID=UPI0008385B01|nr:hypothetical protein [Janibacter terrae]MBA4085308.1 hypothetical protein [Kytococcus sp.]HCE60076.1 hypothetical protein [Janibacter terrae]
MSGPGAKGVVVAGHGVASGRAADSPFAAGTIELQAPHLAARGLDLTPFVMATVNVDLAPLRLVLEEPRWTFADVRWTDVHPAETFSFVECAVTRRGERVEGLVYHPHPETKPMHHQPATVVELLLPRLRGLAPGDALRLEVAEGQARFA